MWGPLELARIELERVTDSVTASSYLWRFPMIYLAAFVPVLGVLAFLSLLGGLVAGHH